MNADLLPRQQLLRLSFLLRDKKNKIKKGSGCCNVYAVGLNFRELTICSKAKYR